MTSKLVPMRCQSCRLAPPDGSRACPFKHGIKSAGETLVEQGDVPANVVYLRRGQVVLTASTASGRDLSCAVRGPNTMLGLEGLLEQRMPYEIRALSDVALCSVDTDSFKAWVGPLDSPVGTVLRLSLDEAMRRAGERHAIEGTAVRRVARFLDEAIGTQRSGEPLPIPLAVLANVLGMRPETMSRALAELRAAGALGDGRSVHVVDREKLRLAAR